MKKCPKCGCEKFYVTAHIIEGWLVDTYGEYIKTTEDCVEVAHYPDNEDLWTCYECGYEESGNVFEKEEN